MEQALDYTKGAQLPDMLDALKEGRARAHDIVAPLSALRYNDDGTLELHEYGHEITLDGVTQQEQVVVHDVNEVAESQVREKAGIPHTYWQRMDGDHRGLRSENVNYWFDASDANVMLRTLAPTEGDEKPLLRALLSDRYQRIDDLDVMLATLDGVRKAGVVDTSALDISCDRTLRRFVMRITAPEIGVAAQDLVDRYRDPRSNQFGRDYPMVWAGLVASNSETGHGAYNLTPRVVFQVCSNGMTRPMDVSKSVHLGGKLDEGVVEWSGETQEKQMELISLKTRDAVATFLSTGYVQQVVDEMRQMSDTRISDPKACVKHIGNQFKYNESQQDDILAAFLSSGDNSAVGMGQAVTNIAQDAHPDAALELEHYAWRVMETAATFG